MAWNFWNLRNKIHTHPDFSKLAIAEAFNKLQRLPRDLPHVFGFDRQVGQTRHAFVARHDQSAAQACSPGWNDHAIWGHMRNVEV